MATLTQEIFKYKVDRYLQSLAVQVLRADNGCIYFEFPFSREFMDEIKSMEGSKWVGPVNKANPPIPAKDTEITIPAFGTPNCWRIENTHRNRFQLDFLFGRKPYKAFDGEIIPDLYNFSRPLYKHQKFLTAFALARHYCIWAAEMGTGKTLSAIELIERSGILDWWYVAPRAVLKAITREFKHWKLKIAVRLMTYDELREEMKDWPPGKLAPQGVIFDESSRIKNATAGRSQAALALANGVRQDWGPKGFVILMSGSPAPKSPVDWWHQCEVACPGFLREGTPDKFQLRLGLFEQKKSIAGGVFNQRVTWLDDENKCAKCGKLKTEMEHDIMMGGHAYIPSVNEISKLYKRMHGLVTVQFKKDCLDLPDKHYRVVELKPSAATKRGMGMILGTAPNAITALTELRTLSDGFQYQEVKDGKEDCQVCGGTKKCRDGRGEVEQTGQAEQTDFEIKDTECPYCDKNGKQDRMVRVTVEVPCPKDDALKDILDEHFDIGRLVIYGGFTGSVDRCVNICLQKDWCVIRVDGRGWYVVDGKKNPIQIDPLELFQDELEDYPRVAFIGQPGAAGMGLTLTASPSIVYFSNDFNAESRIQSEDRIHRPGMDVSRGATIIDLLHLPSDYTVLDNLRKKRKLQDMTLGALQAAIDSVAVDDERLF